jgi:hypothetical protein
MAQWLKVTDYKYAEGFLCRSESCPSHPTWHKDTKDDIF